MIEFITTLAARERLARKLYRGADAGNIDHFRAATAGVSWENLNKLCSIINSMSPASRIEGLPSLIRIANSYDPSLGFTVVAENYDYLQSLGWEAPASTIEVIQAAALIKGISTQQRQALIKFEATRFKLFRSRDIIVSELLERKRGYRTVIVNRPDEVDRIIEIHSANSGLDRTEEIEALLDGEVAGPIASGIL